MVRSCPCGSVSPLVHGKKSIYPFNWMAMYGEALFFQPYWMGLANEANITCFGSTSEHNSIPPLIIVHFWKSCGMIRIICRSSKVKFIHWILSWGLRRRQEFPSCANRKPQQLFNIGNRLLRNGDFLSNTISEHLHQISLPPLWF